MTNAGSMRVQSACRAPRLFQVFVAHGNASIAFEIAEFDPARRHVLDKIDVAVPELLDGLLARRIAVGVVQRRVADPAQNPALLLYGEEFDRIGQLGAILVAGE